jgi:hypothetical protein
MARRLTVLCGAVAILLLLNGCSRCGPFWDDWMAPSKACKSDHF